MGWVAILYFPHDLQFLEPFSTKGHKVWSQNSVKASQKSKNKTLALSQIAVQHRRNIDAA